MKKILFVVLLLGLLVDGVWGANNFYVGGAGAADDATAIDRPQTHPAASIKYVFDNVNLGAGDYVIVQESGEYEKWTWGSVDEGSAVDYVYLTIQDGYTATIKPTLNQTPLYLQNVNYIYIQGDLVLDAVNTTQTGLRIRNCTNAVFDGVSAKNTTNVSGMVVDINSASANSENITIKNGTVQNCSGNVGHGIFVTSYTDQTYLINNVLIENMSVYNTGGSGIRGTGHLTNVTFKDNSVSTTCQESDGDWGIYINGHKDTNSIGGTSWSTPDVNGDSYFVLSTNKSVVAVAASGWLTEGIGVGSLNNGEYFVDTTATPDRLYVNLGGADPENVTTHIVYDWAEDCLIENCSATGTVNGGNDGHGIGYEVGVKNSVISRSLSYNNGSLSAVSGIESGNGFALWGTLDCTIKYNRAFNNLRAGISTANSEGAKIYNNYVYNNQGASVTEYGVYDVGGVSIGGFGDGEFYNNVSTGNIKGFSEGAGSVSITEDYNCAYSNTSANFSDGFVGGAHDITTAPTIGAGVSISGIHGEATPAVDRLGNNVCFEPPDMGDIQSQSRTIETDDYTPTGYAIRTGATVTYKGDGHLDLSGLTDTGLITIKLHSNGLTQFTPSTGAVMQNYEPLRILGLYPWSGFGRQ